MNRPFNYKAVIEYNGMKYSFSEKFENDDLGSTALMTISS